MWSSPFFWIDEDRICIWGCQDLHTDYDVPLASAAIFDVKSGDQIKWFAGPTINAFYYDQYLFSTTEKATPSPSGIWKAAHCYTNTRATFLLTICREVGNLFAMRVMECWRCMGGVCRFSLSGKRPPR
ncbi:hypothetical protein [Hahella chejuensis]|uniref:hypothetical protein n=1 Tax=Hahella chejuensis TaxID=158327 RepID=UPI0005A1B613|nr:hypothetical protein [Hahella chejuensis]